MRFLDDLIVTVMTSILRAVMAVGTGLVYVQFLAIAFVIAMLGTVALAVMIELSRAALFGAY